MTVQHKDITDPNLHEVKGVATALNNSFLKASSGVGVWAFDEDFIDIDIVTLNTVTTYNLIMPHTGTFIKLFSVIDSAFTGADATIQLKIAGVNVTNGMITVTQVGSAAGDIDSATPSALNTATQGQLVSLTVGGGATGNPRCHVSIIFLRTA